jgi:Beta-galactosidase
MRLRIVGVLVVLFGIRCTRASAGSIRGVFALGIANKRTPEAILRDPNVDGVSLLYKWSELEPVQGRFDWRSMDDQISQASAHGKKVSLGIQPGIFSPSWVYANGARAFTFRWDKPWGPPPCTQISFPIPWDPVYLGEWDRFITELGRRYKDQSRLVLVKIEGINAQSPEFLLPHSRSGEHSRPLVSCSPSNDLDEWNSAGYRPHRIVSVWQTLAATYGEAFPYQHLILETGPWEMPAIGEDGSLSEGSGHAPMFSAISQGKMLLDGRFVVQNDGLTAVWSWPQLPALAQGVSIGYQMAWQVTKDPTCRMNHFQRPCDPRSDLQRAIDRGIRGEATYLEIYTADLLNPQLRDLIQNAHQRLSDGR